ncbi:hypothetical protein CCAND95_120014 [Capnocytophaga canis]|uniref:Uncharacterized protein n=1 Tax=Capnocytophaga canis TaxID=1848903 RepID=A0A0B7HXJ9_9FLAO|nr:hypothetical protein CCAND95_120014 [Capnocytophaga canis]CEN53526.1 hypothetical protein CCAND93_460013 [Capnocytophaga canis]
MCIVKITLFNIKHLFLDIYKNKIYYIPFWHSIFYIMNVNMKNIKYEQYHER